MAKDAVSMRSVLAVVPEPVLLKLVKAAKERGITVHALVSRVVSDWVKDS